jgi:serine/threonine protein kinase
MATGDFPTCRACGGSHAPGTTCDEGPDPRIGNILADKYQLVALRGRGGMGSVYEARHVELGRFAIKFLRPEFAVNRAVLRRFENEAKAAGSLEHPNLVAVTDIGRTPDGSPYLVMEFLSGQDCSQLLARLGPLPTRRATNIVFQACRGLGVAHDKGIVHRDIKPENLFITDAGDGTDLVKVLDFGIAKLRLPDATAATGAGVAMGTCFYMSPEQIQNAADVDHRTDVWSLGVVLYELLSGQKPFSSTSPMEVFHQIVHLVPERLEKLRSGLAPELVAVVERTLKKDRAERLPTVTALAEALAPFTGRPSVIKALGAASHVATRPSPDSASGPVAAPTSQAGVATLSKIASATPPSASRRRRAAMILGGVLLVVALGVVAVVSGHDDRDAGLAASGVSAGSGAVSSLAAPGTMRAPEPSASLDVAGPVVLPAASVPPDAAAAAPGGVRRLSEHFEQGSNRAGPVGGGKPSPTSAASARAASAGSPTPTSAPGAHEAPEPTTQPVSIDPQNPY